MNSVNGKADLRIFSYLPNPRVWKAQIAADICGLTVEVRGDKPAALAGWLWDYDAQEIPESERTAEHPSARVAQRGFSGLLFKTDEFLQAHPFGTVPAAFAGDGRTGVFESNSILRAVARQDQSGSGLYGIDAAEATRIDSYLDANLVFAREFQEWLLRLQPGNATNADHERMTGAWRFYLQGIEQTLGNSTYLVGDTLTIADISFACDLAQCLRERLMRRSLEALGMPAVSDGGEQEYPAVFKYLAELCARPEFAPYLADYVEATLSA